jgi:hypothetical protein
MSQQQWAQNQCITKAVQVNVKDLKSLGKAKMKGNYIRDLDGKHIRKVRMKNMDSKLKVGTPPYKFYKDWNKYHGYHSDQWTNEKFSLQKDLYLHTKQKSGDAFYSISDQQNFDMATMPTYPLDVEKDILDDFTLLLIGRRRSGKTWLSRWIMYNLRHRFPFGIVITGTRLNNFWSQYIPEEFIHDIENIGPVLDNIFARQTFLKSHPELGVDTRMFIILDDVMGDKYRTRFSPQLSNCFTNGRHNDILTLITAQDAKGVGPDLRENTDICCIFRVYEGGRKKVIEEEWLSYVEDYKGPTSNHHTVQRDENPSLNPGLKFASVKGAGYLSRPHSGQPRNTKSSRKGGQAAEFFWKNTGLVDPSTYEPFQESNGTTDEEMDKAIPQCIAVLQARTTEDLQKVFKKCVSHDPGPFILGDKDYYEAAMTGNYRPILHTYNKFKRRGRRRVRGEVVLGSSESGSGSSSSSSSEK